MCGENKVQGSVISLRGISRQFTAGNGETVQVLQDVNLDIERGTFTVIRGESGSGKTTLLRILGMLDTGFSGQYLFEDVPISDQPEWYLDELRANNIGFIFQEGRLFSHMTLRRNIEVPLLLQGVHAPTDLRRIVDEQAPTFFKAKEQQNHTLDSEPRKVSGGQAQRASVMRAIITRPSIILADEPTASLHGDLKQEVVQHLLSLTAQGHTVIVVSHDQVFYSVGRQVELVGGVLHERDSTAGAQAAARLAPDTDLIAPRMPAEGRAILNGWRPRAPFGVLVQQAWTETILRPLFLFLVLASLIVGVCQVSVFTSVITGAQAYVNQKITEGSRLNRVQIKPRNKDRDQPDRFPSRGEIDAMEATMQVVPRRATTTRVVVREGDPKTFSVSGLHPDDPEWGLLTFVAGGAFSPANNRPEVILTAGLISEVFDSDAIASGKVTYDDLIGQTVSVIINRYDSQRKLVAQEPVALKLTGIVLNGEGGRQLYFPNQTLLYFDALVQDRKLENRLPPDAGPDNWPDEATLATLTDFPWEDTLHVYAREIRGVLPLITTLSRMGYKPESDIWDYKWALDIQDTAWRVFVPLLVLIVISVVVTVAVNIFTSAKLREAELALWRVLGMRRGDLVLTQIMSIFLSVTVGTLAGLGLSTLLIDQTRDMLQRRSAEAAAATGEDAQDFDAIFAPVGDFFWAILVAAIVIGLLAALWPSIRTARTDPAKVLQG